MIDVISYKLTRLTMLKIVQLAFYFFAIDNLTDVRYNKPNIC